MNYKDVSNNATNWQGSRLKLLIYFDGFTTMVSCYTLISFDTKAVEPNI